MTVITDCDTLAILVAAHLHLGEARLSSFLESVTGPPVFGETGPHQEELFRSLREIRLPRPIASAARRMAARLSETGACALTVRDEAYPDRVRRLLGAKAPAVLYVRGNVGLFSEPSVAIIGTRRPSAAGRLAARSWAEALARAGWMVTSGNAPGVDAVAHQAALRAGGRTLVYPPVPLDVFEPSFDPTGSPPEALLVASPFAPGTAVAPWCFLRRNELVAAQSGAALVAETGTRGGTLNTVGHVRRLGRDLFVTDLPDAAAHRRAHEMLAAGGARRVPVECTPAALRTLLRAAARPLPARSGSADLFTRLQEVDQ